MTPKHPTLTYCVRNCSSRNGATPRLIVIHTTEGSNRPGISDLQGLAEYFDNPAVQASSHVANDAEGHDIRMVADGDKAWTEAADNPFSLSIEQIAFSSWSRDEWFSHPHQLANTANWIAYWSAKFDIPIRRGAAPAGYLLRSGVAAHKWLGFAGGGHSDPGPGFPWRYVLLMARYFRASHAGEKPSPRLRNSLNRIRRHYHLEAL